MPIWAMQGIAECACSMLTWCCVSSVYYPQQTGDSQHNSAAFLPPLIEDGIRVLIYAGNADAMCSWRTLHSPKG